MLSVALPSALFAGGVAIGVTVAIERWGGRIGGVLGTLPSTIIPAAIGIYLSNEDPLVFQHAMDATPLGMLVNGIFLWSWRSWPHRLPPRSMPQRLAIMVLLTMATWLLCALGVVSLSARWIDSGFDSLWLGLTGVIILGGLGLGASLHARPSPRGKRSVGTLALLSRGLFAATAIGLAVWLSKTAGGLTAGVVSVFPAIFLTTMVSIWISQGEDVQLGAIGPMILGSSSVAAFALAARWTLPAYGPTTGTLLAWVLAVALASFPAWKWLQWRQTKTALHPLRQDGNP